MQSDDGELLLNCVIQSCLLEVWQRCYLITFIGWSFSSAFPFKKLDRGNICLHKSREICKAEVSPQKLLHFFSAAKLRHTLVNFCWNLHRCRREKGQEVICIWDSQGLRLNWIWNGPNVLCLPFLTVAVD